MTKRKLSDLVSGRFLPGFAWAVGREFSDAMRMCAFNEGDVLYSCKSAYNGWSGIDAAAPMFQVLRADTKTTASFEENWYRQVWIKVWTSDTKGKYLDCPAGCLFHVLQAGDVIYLDQAPPSRLPRGTGVELRRALKEIKGPSGTLALPFDLVVKESVWKIRRIIREFEQDPEMVAPTELGLDLSVRPTVYIAMLDRSSLSDEQVKERLRRAINPDAKSVALGSHGVRY